MISASTRKSLADLRQRRGRSLLAGLTLTLAVASVSFLAIPSLIDARMQEEVVDSLLADVTVRMRPVVLDDVVLAELASLPNVVAVEPRSSVDIRVLVGERRAPARVIGVRDFDDQRVDLVRAESGIFPGDGELLVDVQVANVGLDDRGAGDRLSVVEPVSDFEISGRGRSLPGGELVQDENVIVLYATATTVAELSGDPGVNSLALRLEDHDPASVARTLDATRQVLAAVPGFAGFSNLPAVRSPGDWPGRSDTEDFGKFIAVITLLALISAVVLVSNTMSTLIAEQTKDIAVMRAIGARRRTVARVYLTTSLILGAAGALVGTAVGVILANLLAASFGQMFWAVGVGFRIDAPVLVASLLVGLIIPPLAALPAIRRGLRTDLRDALEASGSALGEVGATDRVLRRVRFVPRVAQVGLRNLGRRKTRSLATVVIVALAVANLLAVLALSAAATESTRTSWSSHLEDFQVVSAGQSPFDERAESAIRSTPGVAEVEAVVKNTARLGDREAFVWGVEHEPLFAYRLSSGRWFDDREAAEGERVAVIERNLAQRSGVGVGDTVDLTTAAGNVELHIVGIATNQQENGSVLYVPLAAARAVLGQPTGATSYWIRAESRDTDVIDRTTTLVEDSLVALGYQVATEVTYVAERDEVAANRTLTASIAILGFVIVAMSMVGLANAITANVFERTREIGILRCIGARGRQVRRIFATEGAALALVGWLVGVPLGYVFTRLLVRLVWEVIDVRLPVVFPIVHVILALVGTLALALLVLLFPLRRAVRLRAGEALRYG